MEIDVAANIKAIELLKVELLQNITDFFGDICAENDSDTDERIAGHTADIILVTKLLSKRLGVDSVRVENIMIKKLENEIENGHILERRFNDLSAVLMEIREDRDSYEKYNG